MTTRVLFVCLGNICRSPSAENIMNYLIAQRQLGDRISCDSAGTASYHVGSAPDSRMNVAAQKKGITLTGSARSLFKKILKRLILFWLPTAITTEISCHSILATSTNIK